METKKIQLNPSLLRVSEKTRRNRAPRNGGGTASERSERSKVTSANLVKKQILNKIRQNYRDAEKYDGGSDNEDIPIHTDNSEFESSVQYFNNLKQKMSAQSGGGGTIASPPQIQPQMPATAPFPVISAPAAPIPQLKTPPLIQPQYGCLKGGSLPTFRNWQKTQKNPNYYNNNTTPPPIVATPVAAMGGAYYQPPSFVQSAPAPSMSTPIASSIVENRSQPSDWQKEKERIHQIMEQRRAAEKSIEVAQSSVPMRKRKVTRRTYHVGKSKIHPKVSVLLSNKTIRSQIMTEKQHYNEIPINDVKQYLQKKGLIKIGSNSPNHVLRSMYESAMLLGGDIVNHNKDTLLHNFLKSASAES